MAVALERREEPVAGELDDVSVGPQDLLDARLEDRVDDVLDRLGPAGPGGGEPFREPGEAGDVGNDDGGIRLRPPALVDRPGRGEIGDVSADAAVVHEASLAHWATRRSMSRGRPRSPRCVAMPTDEACAATHKRDDPLTLR